MSGVNPTPSTAGSVPAQNDSVAGATSSAGGPAVSTPSVTAPLGATGRPNADLSTLLVEAGVVPLVADASLESASTPLVRKSAAAPPIEADSQDTDRLDNQDRPRESGHRSQDAIKDRGLERNPFQRLGSVRDIDAHALELGASVDLDVEIDLPEQFQGKWLSFVRKASSMRSPDKSMTKTIDAMAEGALLVVDDATGTQARKQGLNKAAARAETRRFLTKVARNRHLKRIAHIMQQTRLARIGTDPHSFIMRVMRESYALGNETLKDYAERMKKTNALRKDIRAELQRTAEAIRATAGADEEDLLEVPFDKKTVDATAKQISDAFYSLEEVTEQQNQLAAEREAAKDHDPTDRPSELDGGEKANLREWAKDDDTIEDNEDRIIEMIPRMSNADRDALLKPIFAKLVDKDDESEALRIAQALDGPTFVRFLAQGVFTDNDGDLFFDGEQGEGFRTTLNDKLQELSDGASFDAHEVYGTLYDGSFEGRPNPFRRAAGTVVSVGAILGANYTGGLSLGLLNRFGGGTNRREQRASASAADGVLELFLDRLRNPEAYDDFDAPAQPSVDDRKQAKTVGELQDYEKYLEEQLNSVGEDGQLLNLELQNQLQNQQQQLQMMSNMSKAVHDVAMSILRNVSG